MDAPGATTPQEPARARTILVADDDHGIRTLLAESLRQENHTVLTASDGAEALALAQGSAATIDLLITDFEMPVLNGIQLAAGVRALFPGIIVILISGSPVRGAEAAAASAFLEKPFPPCALLEKVTALLDRA